LIRWRAYDSLFYNSISETGWTTAFRHGIAHGYDVVVDEIIGEIGQKKILALLDEARRLFST
jgi:hypothetical protein